MSRIQKNTLILICIDTLIITVCIAFTFLLHTEGRFSSETLKQMFSYQILCIAIIQLSFVVNSLYKREWRFASIGEVLAIGRTVTLSMIVANLLMLIIVPRMPLSIVFTSYLSILLSLGASRLGIRIVKDGYQKGKQKYLKRALIIGAGQCGVLIAKELKFNSNAKTIALGFIDDDHDKLNQRLIGIPVLGDSQSIPTIVEEHNITDIIVAIPSASKKRISEIISICNQTTVKIQIIPNISDLIEGKVSLKSMRNVDVEDLLGREPVVLENEGIEEYIQNKVILVTGAGGSIGSELCRQIANFNPKKLLLLGHGENSIYQIHQELNGKVQKLIPIIADVQDKSRLEQIFSRYRPHVVFHAAAHKHVPLMETNPSEAIKNNVFGTRHVADCADQFGVEKFVLISTDKAVNPTSIMGTTKRIAEMYIQSLSKHSKTKYSAVRFGNVLGSRGSVIPLFRSQIAKGGPVTVTHPEMIRYFMTIPEASRLVLQAGGFAKGGEVFVLDMGKPVKIYELAKQLIRLSGFEPDVDIKVEFSGMRPGEKLYEELLLEEEGMINTRHERIFIGKPVTFNRENIEFELRRLERTLDQDKEAIQEIIVDMVPTYTGYKKKERVLVPGS